jgi:hypothetical protein
MGPLANGWVHTLAKNLWDQVTCSIGYNHARPCGNLPSPVACLNHRQAPVLVRPSPLMRFAIAIWTFYAIGGFLHAWLRAGSVISSKLNGIGSYRHYIQLNAPVLAIRFFVSSLGLMWWGWHPSSFTSLAHFVGWNMPLDVPLNPVTAGAYGIFADTLIDLVAARIPMLQKEIPPIGGIIVTQKETTAITTAETTTEKTTVVPNAPVKS